MNKASGKLIFRKQTLCISYLALPVKNQERSPNERSCYKFQVIQLPCFHFNWKSLLTLLDLALPKVRPEEI